MVGLFPPSTKTGYVLDYHFVSLGQASRFLVRMKICWGKLKECGANGLLTICRFSHSCSNLDTHLLQKDVPPFLTC